MAPRFSAQESERRALERFWDSFVRDPDTECWEWTRTFTRGRYAAMAGPRRKRWRAARYAWTILRGPIPEGLVIDHLCNNPGCVNPDHLRVCTQMENVYAAHSNTAGKRRGQQVECHKGHKYADVGLYWIDGRRTCAECRRISSRAYYRRTHPHAA